MPDYLEIPTFKILINKKTIQSSWAVLVFLTFINKIPQTGWLKKTEMYCFTVVETVGLKSSKTVIPLKSLENFSLSLLASDVCWQPLVLLGLQMHLLSVPSRDPPLCVFLKDQGPASLKSASPNTVMF